MWMVSSIGSAQFRITGYSFTQVSFDDMEMMEMPSSNTIGASYVVDYPLQVQL